MTCQQVFLSRRGAPGLRRRMSATPSLHNTPRRALDLSFQAVDDAREREGADEDDVSGDTRSVVRMQTLGAKQNGWT